MSPWPACRSVTDRLRQTTFAALVLGMFSTDDLADLGVEPTAAEVASAADATTATAPETPAPRIADTRFLRHLEPGSTTAQALFRVWQGYRATVVDSPPGAGKSLLVATVVAHLAARSGLRVVVATPTRPQAQDIAIGIARRIAKPSSVSLALSGALEAVDVEGRGFLEIKLGAQGAKPTAGRVVVRTLASCALAPPEADVLVIDEAYQSTYADVATASDRCTQLLLVGDPGQIGPVVTVDTTEWERMDAGPHRRTPEVVSRMPDAQVLNLTQTYRFGQETVDVIAPMYAFPFTSARSPRMVVGEAEVASCRSKSTGDAYSMALMQEVADRAVALVGKTLRVDGEPDRKIEPADIAVVAARNVQVNSLRALMNSAGMAETTVGTADKLQGGQWEAVVALDPLVGATDGGATAHGLSLGRLCVMLSRHKAHLTWVHDGEWAEALETTAADRAVISQHLAVRKKVTAAERTPKSREGARVC